MEIKIKDLEGLLKPTLGSGKKILSYTTTSLTKPGENYGSLILAVDVKLETNDDRSGETSEENSKTNEDRSVKTNETLHIAAKLLPANEWLKKMFKVEYTFKKEAGIYTTIFPILQEFQREQGVEDVIDFFPKCYGARVSLNPESNEVDDDAALLLENLKCLGYECVDRMKGFDYETAQLIIKDLAQFHALPIALKIMKPDVFESKILPLLENLPSFDAFDPAAEKFMLETLVNKLKMNEKCVPLIPNFIEEFNKCMENMKTPPLPKEPYATINHNDLWVNNTLVKFVNGKPIKNKMVDFQIIMYGSPAKDLLFLLYSSLQKELTDKYYDHFIQLYYETFISTLKQVNCDTEPFTFDLLLEEIDNAAKTSEFFHLIVMLRPIFSEQGAIKDMNEISEEYMMSDRGLSEMYFKRLYELVLDFAEKKWI